MKIKKPKSICFGLLLLRVSMAANEGTESHCTSFNPLSETHSKQIYSWQHHNNFAKVLNKKVHIQTKPKHANITTMAWWRFSLSFKPKTVPLLASIVWHIIFLLARRRCCVTISVGVWSSACCKLKGFVFFLCCQII